MNAEQKQRIAHEISNWRNARNDHSSQITGDRMAALLQELAEEPEPEPVARVTGYYAGYLSIATVDGRVLPAGTALYAAPPPPKLSDERILEIWASNSGRPVTMGKARIIAQARAIEREILGCVEK